MFLFKKKEKKNKKVNEAVDWKKVMDSNNANIDRLARLRTQVNIDPVMEEVIDETEKFDKNAEEVYTELTKETEGITPKDPDTGKKLPDNIYTKKLSLDENLFMDSRRAKKMDEGWRGTPVEMVSHGSWGDPDLVWNGYTFNYWDIEDAMWEMFLEDTGHTDDEANVPQVEEEFNEYVQDNYEDYLNDVLTGGYFEGDSTSWHDRYRSFEIGDREEDIDLFPMDESKEKGKKHLRGCKDCKECKENLEEGFYMDDLLDDARKDAIDIVRDFKENNSNTNDALNSKGYAYDPYSGTWSKEVEDGIVIEIEVMYDRIEFSVVNEKERTGTPRDVIKFKDYNKIKNKTKKVLNKKENLEEELKLIADISDYTPWSGAVETWGIIEDNDAVEDLEFLLEDIYPEGLTMTELNDILWFESDWVLENLGLSEDEDEEEFEDEEEEEEIEEESLNEEKEEELPEDVYDFVYQRLFHEKPSNYFKHYSFLSYVTPNTVGKNGRTSSVYDPELFVESNDGISLFLTDESEGNLAKAVADELKFDYVVKPSRRASKDNEQYKFIATIKIPDDVMEMQVSDYLESIGKSLSDYKVPQKKRGRKKKE